MGALALLFIDWFRELLSSNLAPDRCTCIIPLEMSSRTGDAGAVDRLITAVISNGVETARAQSLLWQDAVHTQKITKCREQLGQTNTPPTKVCSVAGNVLH